MRTLMKLLMASAFVAVAFSTAEVSAQAPLERYQLGDTACTSKVGPEGLLRPGDHGYMHGCLHPFYQQLYSSGKCSCLTGSCRPTVARMNTQGQEEILIQGEWYVYPDEALRRERADIPEGLWGIAMHVCAFPDPISGRLPVGGLRLPNSNKKMQIECVIRIREG